MKKGQAKGEKRNLLSLIKTCKYLNTKFLVCVLLSIVVASLNLMRNVMTGKMLDYLKDLNILINVTAIIVAIIIFQAVLNNIKNYMLSKHTVKSIGNLRIMLGDVICKSELYEIENHESGDILSRTMEDINTIQSVWRNLMPRLFVSVIESLGAFIICIYISWKLTLISFAVIPISLFLTIISTKSLEKSTMNKRKILGALNGMILNIVSLNDIVKSYTLENTFLNKVIQKTKEYLKSANRVIFLKTILIPIGVICSMLPLLIVFGVGSVLVINNEATLGEIVTYVMVFNYVFQGIVLLQTFPVQLREASSAAQRINEIISLPLELDDYERGVITKESIENILELKDVTFSYNGTSNILTNFNLSIHKGETVGIVGRSGSGKSTILKLFTGLYLPDSGKVHILSKEMTRANREQLRENIMMVWQENYVFPKSIFENIIIGNLNATKDEVVKACKIAEIHECIMALPDGYDTPIGEGGNLLSGGEKQRISIARALLKKGSVLILDEPTSALDVYTEYQLGKTLEKITKEMTCVIVSHRPFILKNADRIICIEDGEIAKEGTYEELYNKQVEKEVS